MARREDPSISDALPGLLLGGADPPRRSQRRAVSRRRHSRCRVHWMRNALAHAPAKQRTAVEAMLKTIFAQDTKAETEAQRAMVADALREKHGLAAMMDASRDNVLAYMDFSKEHWTQIVSTNPPERVNREIKRRDDVVGVGREVPPPEGFPIRPTREIPPPEAFPIRPTSQRSRHYPPGRPVRRRRRGSDRRPVSSDRWRCPGRPPLPATLGPMAATWRTAGNQQRVGRGATLIVP